MALRRTSSQCWIYLSSNLTERESGVWTRVCKEDGIEYVVPRIERGYVLLRVKGESVPVNGGRKEEELIAQIAKFMEGVASGH